MTFVVSRGHGDMPVNRTVTRILRDPSGRVLSRTSSDKYGLKSIDKRTPYGVAHWDRENGYIGPEQYGHRGPHGHHRHWDNRRPRGPMDLVRFGMQLERMRHQERSLGLGAMPTRFGSDPDGYIGYGYGNHYMDDASGLGYGNPFSAGYGNPFMEYERSFGHGRYREKYEMGTFGKIAAGLGIVKELVGLGRELGLGSERMESRY